MKVHIVVDSKCIVINLKTTSRTTSDGTIALDLIKTIQLGALFRGWVYDTNSIISYAEQLGVKTVIPPKFNRKSKRNFDSDLYRLPHIVENTLLKFKCWRSIASRYFETSVAFRVSFFARYIPCLLLLSNFFVTAPFFIKLFSFKKFCSLPNK